MKSLFFIIRIIDQRNETYFLTEIISGIGAITSYPTFLFDGNGLVNLNNIYLVYKDLLDKKKLTLLSDNQKGNPEWYPQK